MDLTKVLFIFLKNNSPLFFVLFQFDIKRKVVLEIELSLFQMFVKALREMANPNGSSIQNVERHIRKAYSVEVDSGYFLEDLLRNSAKKAVSKNLATHDGSFTYFKSTSTFKKNSSGGIKSSKTTGILGSFNSKSKMTHAPVLEEKYEDTVSTEFFVHLYYIIYF